MPRWHSWKYGRESRAPSPSASAWERGRRWRWTGSHRWPSTTGCRSLLADVDRALEKVDEGSYGRCDVCGNPIGEGRLHALPWAVRCVSDAAR